MANNRYAEVAAPIAYAAATSPSLDADFTPDYWVLTPISGGDVYYSFDGINNHGRVKSTFTIALILESKAEKIWLKQVAGAATVGIAVATRI